MRRRELSKDIKEVHSRLNTTSKELRQCITNLTIKSDNKKDLNGY